MAPGPPRRKHERKHKIASVWRGRCAAPGEAGYGFVMAQHGHGVGGGIVVVRGQSSHLLDKVGAVVLPRGVGRDAFEAWKQGAL